MLCTGAHSHRQAEPYPPQLQRYAHPKSLSSRNKIADLNQHGLWESLCSSGSKLKYWKRLEHSSRLYGRSPREAHVLHPIARFSKTREPRRSKRTASALPSEIAENPVIKVAAPDSGETQD